MQSRSRSQSQKIGRHTRQGRLAYDGRADNAKAEEEGGDLRVEAIP